MAAQAESLAQFNDELQRLLGEPAREVEARGHVASDPPQPASPEALLPAAGEQVVQPEQQLKPSPSPPPSPSPSPQQHGAPQGTTSAPQRTATTRQAASSAQVMPAVQPPEASHAPQQQRQPQSQFRPQPQPQPQPLLQPLPSGWQGPATVARSHSAMGAASSAAAQPQQWQPPVPSTTRGGSSPHALVADAAESYRALQAMPEAQEARLRQVHDIPSRVKLLQLVNEAPPQEQGYRMVATPSRTCMETTRLLFVTPSGKFWVPEDQCTESPLQSGGSILQKRSSTTTDQMLAQLAYVGPRHDFVQCRLQAQWCLDHLVIATRQRHETTPWTQQKSLLGGWMNTPRLLVEEAASAAGTTTGPGAGDDIRYFPLDPVAAAEDAGELDIQESTRDKQGPSYAAARVTSIGLPLVILRLKGTYRPLRLSRALPTETAKALEDGIRRLNDLRQLLMEDGLPTAPQTLAELGYAERAAEARKAALGEARKATLDGVTQAGEEAASQQDPFYARFVPLFTPGLRFQETLDRGSAVYRGISRVGSSLWRGIKSVASYVKPEWDPAAISKSRVDVPMEAMKSDPASMAGDDTGNPRQFSFASFTTFVAMYESMEPRLYPVSGADIDFGGASRNYDQSEAVQHNSIPYGVVLYPRGRNSRQAWRQPLSKKDLPQVREADYLAAEETYGGIRLFYHQGLLRALAMGAILMSKDGSGMRIASTATGHDKATPREKTGLPTDGSTWDKIQGKTVVKENEQDWWAVTKVDDLWHMNLAQVNAYLELLQALETARVEDASGDTSSSLFYGPGFFAVDGDGKFSVRTIEKTGKTEKKELVETVVEFSGTGPGGHYWALYESSWTAGILRNGGEEDTKGHWGTVRTTKHPLVVHSAPGVMERLVFEETPGRVARTHDESGQPLGAGLATTQASPLPPVAQMMAFRNYPLLENDAALAEDPLRLMFAENARYGRIRYHAKMSTLAVDRIRASRNVDSEVLAVVESAAGTQDVKVEKRGFLNLKWGSLRDSSLVTAFAGTRSQTEKAAGDAKEVEKQNAQVTNAKEKKGSDPVLQEWRRYRVLDRFPFMQRLDDILESSFLSTHVLGITVSLANGADKHATASMREETLRHAEAVEAADQRMYRRPGGVAGGASDADILKGRRAVQDASGANKDANRYITVPGATVRQLLLAYQAGDVAHNWRQSAMGAQLVKLLTRAHFTPSAMSLAGVEQGEELLQVVLTQHMYESPLCNVMRIPQVHETLWTVDDPSRDRESLFNLLLFSGKADGVAEPGLFMIMGPCDLHASRSGLRYMAPTVQYNDFLFARGYESYPFRVHVDRPLQASRFPRLLGGLSPWTALLKKARHDVLRRQEMLQTQEEARQLLELLQQVPDLRPRTANMTLPEFARYLTGRIKEGNRRLLQRSPAVPGKQACESADGNDPAARDSGFVHMQEAGADGVMREVCVPQEVYEYGFSSGRFEANPEHPLAKFLVHALQAQRAKQRVGSVLSRIGM